MPDASVPDLLMADDPLTDSLLSAAAGRARHYLGTITQRSVGPTPAAVARLATLDEVVPDQGIGAAATLDLLDEVGSPATVASAGPRYFGFVTGGTHPAALAASWLAAAWDQNSALRAMSPTAARFDTIALEWIVDLLGLPSASGAGFVTGATMANAAALAAARDHVLARHGWDAHRDGLVGAPKVRVYVGQEAHATVAKALGLVGLGRGRAHVLPADSQGRVVADDLPPLEPGPTIVCLQAGNVNTGASDPFHPLIDWAHDAGAWVHVDGAFGLWAAAAPERSHLVAGVERADSWATDAHKWLNVSYDSGVVVVKDPTHLAAAMRTDAPYLLSAGAEREPMHYTPQSSQRARGVEAWALIKALGRQGVAEMIERHCRQANRLAQGLTAQGLTVLNPVVLNQVLVDMGPDPDGVVASLQAEGTTWAGTTTWAGKTVLRLSVSNWSTTDDDIDRSVEAIAVAITKLI